MKKASFILLFTLELIWAMIAMGLLMSDLGAICYLIAAVIFTVVLTPFFIKLKKTDDEVKKGKIRRNILLLLLIPILFALGSIISVLVALFTYF
jgi:hypothetical protein